MERMPHLLSAVCQTSIRWQWMITLPFIIFSFFFHMHLRAFCCCVSWQEARGDRYGVDDSVGRDDRFCHDNVKI